MRQHRLARPDRAGFTGGVVANRDDEIQLLAIRLGEFVPALGAQVRDVMAGGGQNFHGVRIDLAFGRGAGAEGLELAFAEIVEDGLAHDRTGGIAAAQEQNVVDAIDHGQSPNLQAVA